MELLGGLSPLVEPLSLDEAFVDLEAGGARLRTRRRARAVGERLRADIRAATGLSGSVGLAGSKMLAKIASEQAKPDGLVLIEPGTERELLAPMSVRTLPGVGPATGGASAPGRDHHGRRDWRRRARTSSCGCWARRTAPRCTRWRTGCDDRPVVAERDAKSVSVEDTFDVDLHDRARVRIEVAAARRPVRAAAAGGRAARGGPSCSRCGVTTSPR